MNSCKIKLAALDLDGTLLTTENRISAASAVALHQLMDMGITVALATGRHFRTASGYTEELGLNGPIICYNGAVVRRVGVNKPDFASYLDDDVIYELVDFTRQRGLYLQLYDEQDRLLVERITSETRADPDFLTTDTVEAGDLKKVLHFRSPKMMIYNHTPDVITSLIPELQEMWKGRLHVVRSNPNLVEMLNPGIDKRWALIKIAEQLGLRADQIIAFGDSDNDAEMLAWSGFGCAVSNATPLAKGAADFICTEEREFGIREALDHFVFQTAAV